MGPGDVARLPSGVRARGLVAVALGGARIDQFVLAPAYDCLRGSGIFRVVEVAEDNEVGTRVGAKRLQTSPLRALSRDNSKQPLMDTDRLLLAVFDGMTA